MIEILNQIAATWWQWMGAMFWQVSLLIIVITAIDMAIRKWAWPQVRYALWLLVLLKLVIPPNWQMQTSIVSRMKPRVEQQILTRFDKPIPNQQTSQPSGFAQPLPMDFSSISQTPLQPPQVLNMQDVCAHIRQTLIQSVQLVRSTIMIAVLNIISLIFKALMAEAVGVTLNTLRLMVLGLMILLF